MTNEITVVGQTIQLNTLSVFREQAEKGAAALTAVLQIKSQLDVDQASDLLNRAKKLKALVDKEVEALCRPLKDYKKEIDEAQRAIKAYAEDVLKGINDVSAKLEKNLIDFARAERDRAERERAEQERIARKQAEREANEAKAESGNEQDDFAFTPQVRYSNVVVEPPKIKGMTESWTFEIDDPFKVPREFCKPDETLIRAAIKSGVREIPGVRIFEDVKIRRT